MITSQYPIALSVITAATLFSTTSNAGFLEENEVSLGFQNAFFTSGFSAKFPFGEVLTLQGVAGISGSLTNFAARGLYEFSEISDASVYGFGSAGVWTWKGSFGFASETVFAIGGGIGIEYDLQLSNPEWLPLSLSAEMGANFASFDNYTGYNTFSLGFGVHYRF